MKPKRVFQGQFVCAPPTIPDKCEECGNRFDNSSQNLVDCRE